jgi:ribosomal protein L16 Arg81 hydroxylase
MGLDHSKVLRARSGQKKHPAVKRSSKLESVLAIKQHAAEMHPRASQVVRRRTMSRDEFLRDFYVPNRPVVLTDVLRCSAAFLRWSPEYLDEVCGDSIVEVMSRRDSNPTYEIDSDSHRTKMPFSEYIDRVTMTSSSNDVYLVANNDFFAMANADILLTEVPKLTEYLSWHNPARQVFFWFGPAGTVTPLHHDLMNVILAQLRGRKRFTLISPEQTPLVYNSIGVYSEVDCEKPNLAKHPLFKKVKKIVLDLNPGDALFIPVGWWHHVRALDLSMTVTYTNFVFPNSFDGRMRYNEHA